MEISSIIHTHTHTHTHYISRLQHPYVHNFIDIDYIPDKRLVVIMEPFCQRGSLKDLIYHVSFKILDNLMKVLVIKSVCSSNDTSEV